MALGYEIGTIMRRNSTVWKCPGFTIKVDEIEGMPSAYVQVQVRNTMPRRLVIPLIPRCLLLCCETNLSLQDSAASHWVLTRAWCRCWVPLCSGAELIDHGLRRANLGPTSVRSGRSWGSKGPTSHSPTSSRSRSTN